MFESKSPFLSKRSRIWYVALLCFRDGRTETVRPCTVESKNFVLAMSDEKSTVGARNQLDSSFFKELQLQSDVENGS